MYALEADGLRAAIAAIKERMGNLANMGPGYQRAAKLMRDFIDRRFATETGPDGKPWRPLLPSTTRTRPLPGTILDQTGNLKDTTRVSGGQRGVTFGSRAPYARKQYFGWKEHSGRQWTPIGQDGNVVTTPGTPSAELLDAMTAELVSHVEKKPPQGDR